MLETTDFKALKIGLATTEDILSWSYGEVKKPETINYRTLKPEKDGLFGEQIFGPTKDWECACGKYKRIRFKGIVCERCGVEVTKSSVRRERMGHIALAAPVTHIWYFKGVPSRLGYLLDMAPKDLEKVIYFAAYMIVSVDEQARHDDLPDLEQDLRTEIHEISVARDTEVNAKSAQLEEELAALEDSGSKAETIRKAKENGEKEVKRLEKSFNEQITRLESVWDKFTTLKVGDLLPEDAVYHELEDRFGDYFEGFMGAEAVQRRLADFDLASEATMLRDQIANGRGQKKIRAIKRLKVVNAFLKTGISPAAMVLNVVPVIPPELRPMVQLDGGRFATSDLNDLYRRVINRNNRLRRLLDLNAPEIIVNNEKRMLQEAVDALFDNGRRGRPVTGTGNRPLKSLSDMLKGKQGRFRQNLLGKRVDYSGRSVIVVGPQLKMHQCGLPKQMALELFKPFVIKRLIELGYAQNIKSAKRKVERSSPEVWDVLEEVIKDRPVLLNRAPTLHRLGIQAFEPLLIEGKAIQLHPLACAAFNADFDGDQMAVHLPLGVEAQAEARILMLSSNNILKPSDGRPVTQPSQDMVIGLYTLTDERKGATGEGHWFSSVAEAIMARDAGALDLNAKVYIRMSGLVFAPGEEPEGFEPGKPFDNHTTLGRALFNQLLPDDFPYYEHQADKGQLGNIVNSLAERYDRATVAQTLDRIKDAGFSWGTRSGITIALSDMVTPSDKDEIVAQYEKRANEVQEQFDLGLTTEAERRADLIRIWSEATDKIADDMKASFPRENNVYRMVNSGARGNWLQVRNIVGIRGLVTDTKGDIIPRPIVSNYREGLSNLEYFNATHGSRKGLADTALRTADSGYLTRRLVDVAQDVIIREHDCGTTRGVEYVIAREVDGKLVRDENVENSVYSRTLAVPAVDAEGTVIADAGSDVGDVLIDKLIAAGITVVKVRSVLTCESEVGVCQMCYGRSLATGKRADIGEAVGIIAAQSIGEPGTQLTLRTFHQGGSASADDITQGLPRVTELFEARTPKNASPISEVAGVVHIEDTEKGRKVLVTPDDGSEVRAYPVLKRAKLLVEDGQSIELGAQLQAGSLDPKEVLRVKGIRATQRLLVDGVQEVYRSQGVPIHDKHIEVIVRQMMRKITVVEHGDTELLPGELVDISTYKRVNRAAVLEKRKPASGRQEVMGITKASLATDSWLSAASFQETTRVLTEAALEGNSDPLVGLKENVIIGKLIPAGTGLARYRDSAVAPTEEARAERYPNRLFDDSVDFSKDELGFADVDDFGNFEPGTYN